MVDWQHFAQVDANLCREDDNSNGVIFEKVGRSQRMVVIACLTSNPRVFKWPVFEIWFSS